MSRRQQKKLLFGLFVASLILTISFSVYPTPKVSAQSGIWDNCESLSSSNRVWYTSAAAASLSIDTSVKSSLGTGSVRVDIPASSIYDLYVQEWFGQSPAVLNDFTAARPTSVFVEGSRAVDWRIEIVTREPSGYAWNAHVVARQTVPAWTLTEIQLGYSGISNAALQMVGAVSVIPMVNAQSFTGYIAGISEQGSSNPPQQSQVNPNIGMTVQENAYPGSTAGLLTVNISPSNAKITTWSGTYTYNGPTYEQWFTPASFVVGAIPPPNTATITYQDPGTVTVNINAGSHVVVTITVGSGTSSGSGSVPGSGSGSGSTSYSTSFSALHVSWNRIVDTSNTPVLLCGIAWQHGEDDPTLSGSWAFPEGVATRLSFMQSQRLNFLKMWVKADWVLSPYQSGTDYLQNIENLCTLANSYGIYVEFCFTSWAAGGGASPIPYSPYGAGGLTTNSFNQAVSILAGRLSNHPNALLGIWNEPAYTDSNDYNRAATSDQYNVYFRELPNTLQVARNAGFGGVIVVMGGQAWTPGKWSDGDMTWAIDHKSLFTNYGSVVADFHAYYCYLNAYGDYPDDYNQLYSRWFNTGRIAEAQSNGICVVYFEGGVRMTDSNVGQQIAGYSNALRLCNANGISWSGWVWSTSDAFRMLSNSNPIQWNGAGQVLANSVP